MAGQGMMMQSMGINLIYSFVILLICLLAYIETREISRLSSHKGVDFFRNTFLFFGISYLLAFIFSFGFFNRSFHIPGNIIFFGIMIYASLMAGVYLVLTIGSKKLPKNTVNIEIILHSIAILFTFVVLLFNNFLIHIALQILILVIGIIFLYSDKKKTSMIVIYQLLLLFWIFGIIDIFIPNFFRELQMIIYLASITVFFLVLYKMNKSMQGGK
jgi:hypothetical protein